MYSLFQIFKDCHHGTINKILHFIGLITILFGIISLNIYFVFLGAACQECGHVYQYWKYKKPQDHPLHCLKPQLFFVYPLLVLILGGIIYFS